MLRFFLNKKIKKNIINSRWFHFGQRWRLSAHTHITKTCAGVCEKEKRKVTNEKRQLLQASKRV